MITRKSFRGRAAALAACGGADLLVKPVMGANLITSS